MRTLALLLLAGALSASPIQITSGSVNLNLFDVGWSLAGNGFAASGFRDASVQHCPICLGPFQLVDPLPFTVLAGWGSVTYGGIVYELPRMLPPTGPHANGSITVTPQGTLPIVATAGTYDVPFNIAGSFCTAPDPTVFIPIDCFSVLGSAIAHYTVIQTSTPGWFFQPRPTIEILTHTPEPGTWLIGIPLALCVVFRRSISAAIRQRI